LSISISTRLSARSSAVSAVVLAKYKNFFILQIYAKEKGPEGPFS